MASYPFIKRCSTRDNGENVLLGTVKPQLNGFFKSFSKSTFLGAFPFYDIGFLHDFSDYQTKQSLVYDLQEPFRWIGDVTVLQAIESGTLDLKDFYFMGDDYRYHFDVEAKRRFLELLKNRFNSGALYRGSNNRWDTIIIRKAQELARYLAGKSKEIDFSDPGPRLTRTDNREIRNRILQMSQGEAKALGIGPSSLHYLRKHAKDEKSFKIYSKVANKLKPIY